jgi:acetolactate synthase-1/2/3 large subunit
MQLAQLKQPSDTVALTADIAAKKATVADVVVAHLINEGVTKVFGIPGGATIPFHIALETAPGIDFVLTRHEGGAAFMADCFARTTGQLGVCCSTTGPGATNLITGVAAAFADSVPMLVITGMNPLDAWGRGDFQESSPYAGIDTTALFASVCKSSETIVSEKTLQFRLRNAIATATTGRPGPVHLSIPRDLWAKQITPEIWDRSLYIPTTSHPSQVDVGRVADLLASADSPLIVYGSGASRTAAERLLDVAERLSVPVVTTPRAKGKGLARIPDLLLGNMGMSSQQAVDDLFCTEAFDVILTVGAGFGSYATNSWDQALRPSTAMIQVNIDPNAIGRVYPADIGIVSDGEAFATALRDHVLAVRLAPERPRPERLSRYASQVKWDLSVRESADATHALDIIRAADAAAGENAIVMADSNSILLWATCHLPERPGRRFVSVWGSASMGHVTAGAIGAKLANPGADVIAMVGDGCFLMNGNEVSTAVDLGLPIVWIVNANRQLGMIHFELRATGKTASATLGGYDLAAFAAALGARGVRHHPGDDLAQAVRDALMRKQPTVIQVDITPIPIPPMGLKKEGGRKWSTYINNL